LAGDSPVEPGDRIVEGQPRALLWARPSPIFPRGWCPMSRVPLLLLAVVAALLLPLPLSLPVAYAASASDAQNPDITVSLSMPDQASIGDTVAATLSIS